MEIEDGLTREQEARVIVHAIEEGERIVDSIAKKDGKWRQRVKPYDEAMAEIRAYVEKCKAEDVYGK